MKRGLRLLLKYEGVSDVPEWLYSLNFEEAVHRCVLEECGGYAQTFRRAERELRRGTAWEGEAACARSPMPPGAADDEFALRRTLFATTRLALGAAIEAAVAKEAAILAPPGTRKTDVFAISRLYNDAFLAAVWSSSHAMYVSSLQDGTEEPPPPSVFTVPNAYSTLDLTDLFARRTCPRQCPKEAQPLLHVLMRSTWNTLLDSALNESMACRVVVGNAVIVALSAMHPHLHPLFRPPWQTRMRIQAIAARAMSDRDSRPNLVKTALPTKEAVRRLLSTTMLSAPAMHYALHKLGHPVGLLSSPPTALPAKGMEGAMVAYAYAGIELQEGKAVDYARTVLSAFDRVDAATNAGFAWDASWLGKGTASVHCKIPLLNVASEIWSTAFRTNFLVYWAHCAANQIRSSRLDYVQHRAIHSLNAATRLVNELTDAEQLQAQRAAIACPSSGVMTIEEVATLLGIEGVKGTSSNGGAKGASDGLVSISGAGAHAAARILAFSRAAWVHEEVLTAWLGARTMGMQVQSLHRRLKLPGCEAVCARDAATITMEEALAALPVASTHLHVCLECKRVANSFSSDADKSDAFNELGTSSAMMCTVCDGSERGTTHIRCAKRSSAALRSAVSFEERMENVEVETLNPSASACERVLCERGTSAESGVAARVRRDAKNALEQRASALACGEQAMLRVNMLGRAVRVYNEWFALCSFCGCALKVTSLHRFGGEICCKRCDAAMLGFDVTVPEKKDESTFCRFCGRENAGTSVWKTIKAPLDSGGRNASVPPPLRTVTYCSLHWRPWLTGAHRVLQTRVILSHIAHGAKPVFNSAQSRKHGMGDLGFEEENDTGAKGKRKGKRKPRGAEGPSVEKG